MEKSRSITSSHPINNNLTEYLEEKGKKLPFILAKDFSKMQKNPLSGKFDSKLKPEFEKEPLIVTQDTRYSKEYSNSIQNWLGHIIEIRKNKFIAELEDLTNQGTKEMAEFSFDSISPEDRPLLKIGAAFYWSIGRKMSKGQISKESFIRFQRLILWDEEDYNNAIDRADDLFKNLKFE